MPFGFISSKDYSIVWFSNLSTFRNSSWALNQISTFLLLPGACSLFWHVVCTFYRLCLFLPFVCFVFLFVCLFWLLITNIIHLLTQHGNRRTNIIWIDFIQRKQRTQTTKQSYNIWIYFFNLIWKLINFKLLCIFSYLYNN
jgi:hypothetical protein